MASIQAEGKREIAPRFNWSCIHAGLVLRFGYPPLSREIANQQLEALNGFRQQWTARLSKGSDSWIGAGITVKKWLLGRTVNARWSYIMKKAVFAIVAGIGLSSSLVAQVALTGAGSTFVEPIMAKWIVEYEKTHSDVRITYIPIGSSAGIAQTMRGMLDFGGTDAPPWTLGRIDPSPTHQF